MSPGKTAFGERTKVSIDHLVPEERGGGPVRWRITTRTQLLPRDQFDERARSRINAASAERGRRLYCIDVLSQEVLAALAYHVDDRPGRPVLLTAIALRIDADGTADLFRTTRARARLLKEYVHAISSKLGRGGFIDIDAPNRREVLDELDLLGFRRARRVKGFEPGGVHLRQRSSSD